MAAVVHGCGSSSPRQHHGTHISCPSTATSHHKHQPTMSVFSTTMPKYTRSVTLQLATPSSNHRQVYGGNNLTGIHQYSTPLPYLPTSMGTAAHKHTYATTQHPISNTLTDSGRNYWGHSTMYRVGRHHSKRKTAVELLAETKPFYVKSDTVMERLHQSNYRASTISIGGKRGRPSIDEGHRDEVRYKPSSYGDVSDAADLDLRFSASPPLPHLHQGRGSSRAHHHHHRVHHAHASRHNTASSNNQLQSGMRMFMCTDAHKDRGMADVRNYMNDIPQRKIGFTEKINSTGSTKELANIVFSNDDDVTFRLPPPSYHSPQPYENVFKYGIDNSSSDEPLILTENYRPISPPAEYAAKGSIASNEPRTRYNYQRSYSHSHEAAVKNSKFNINSHKSMPDLHSQISRHSPHSEILSCCSRGNRSIKSAGESSLNRDSGGSSGHYTHRSEPCYRQQRESVDREIYMNKNCANTITPMDYRRDSGSSTQHSGNSYCGGYISPSYLRNTDCTECRCKNEMRFESAEYLLNFTTPEVPEAFQDNYTPTSPSASKYKIEESQYSNISLPKFNNAKISGNERSPKNSIPQSPCSAPSVEDISPPPIQFKRQRCIRFKNRNRISLPGTLELNTTDTKVISTYTGEKSNYFFPKYFSSNLYQDHEKPLNETVLTNVGENANKLNSCDKIYESTDGVKDLEKFFDRLGLNDDRFHEIYSTPKRRRSAESDSEGSGTVFFSDVSTVDSMRLPDSTESQTSTSQPYRPSEPPSIVERNARIIKWLCNCRKLQYA